jgi:hypothetical protein
MKTNIIAAIAAIRVLPSIASTPLAAPMWCSDEQKVCAAACSRALDATPVTTCVTN